MAIDQSSVDYRPASYWGSTEAILANIKGERRRLIVQQAIAEGTAEHLPVGLLGDDISPELRWLLQNLRPRTLAGETLPSYVRGEVEIARLVYPGTALGDVVSFRARPAGSRIRYRAITDNADDLPCRRQTSAKPLSMRQLVELIEGAGHGISYWSAQRACGISLDDLPRSYVASAFYPDLQAFYAREAERWRQQQRSSA